MKAWINKAIELLDKSLGTVPQELNELDWKEDLSPNKEKLCKHISAFANHPGGGYIVFGVNDKTAQPIGIKRDNVRLIIDKLTNLCRDGVNPLVSIDHELRDYKSHTLLFVYFKESAVKPVHLANKTIEDSFIRSGGSTRQASRQDVGGLMLNSKTPVFEELHASKLKNELEVLTLLDYAEVYNLLGIPVPSTYKEIMDWMVDEKMIVDVDGQGYYISNFGALAAANSLMEFDSLQRKGIRVIKYEGKNKVGNSKEHSGKRGYAIGFKGLISFVDSLLPGSEVIQHALRTETSIYPKIAIRELIANSLIHQDFTIRGSSPMVEIFEDRIEFSNPGRLLPSKKIDRLIRTTPESRNEVLAQAFRRYNICEERGSGFEKAVIAIELYGLPPLQFEETENSFKVIMYAPKTFAQMGDKERIDACYQHAVIQYYGNSPMNNASLRKRFGMHDKQASQISRLITAATKIGKIKPKDPDSDSKKFTTYLPYWA
jgi:predicted HTH transcriptional regulator